MNWKNGGWALAVVLAILPLVWVVGARIVHVRVASSQDPLGLVSTMAALMGTVFVVGGLVIGLASLSVLLDVDRRVKERIDASVPGLLKEAEKQVQAYVHVLQAQNPWGTWEQAADEIQQAQQLFPQVKGAARAVGLKASHAALARFDLLHGYMSTETITYGIDSNRVIRRDLPTLQAIDWLREAEKQKDEEGGLVGARLSAMYGIAGDYKDMLASVRRTVKEFPAQADYLRSVPVLIALSHACTSARQLQELGNVLEADLPRDDSSVIESIRRARDAAPLEPKVDWWVCVRREPRTIYFKDVGCRPAVLRLYQGLENGELAARAELFECHVRREIIPDPRGPNWLPASELVERLQELFVFVTQQDELHDPDNLAKSMVHVVAADDE